MQHTFQTDENAYTVCEPWKRIFRIINILISAKRLLDKGVRHINHFFYKVSKYSETAGTFFAGTRARKNPMPRYVPTDWDDSLPYGGKVYLARKKKPDSWLCIFIQVRF